MNSQILGKADKSNNKYKSKYMCNMGQYGTFIICNGVDRHYPQGMVGWGLWQNTWGVGIEKHNLRAVKKLLHIFMILMTLSFVANVYFLKTM